MQVLLARNRLEYEHIAEQLARRPRALRALRAQFAAAQGRGGADGTNSSQQTAGGFWDVRARAARIEALSRMCDPPSRACGVSRVPQRGISRCVYGVQAARLALRCCDGGG